MPARYHASWPSLPFFIRVGLRPLTMPAVMPMVHEEVHQRTGEDQEVRQHAKDMRGVLRQQEKPRHDKEPAGDDPDRGPPPGRLFVFMVHRPGPLLSARDAG